ncbi:MAG: hypothetical protein JXR37_10495 [Kiritimatiellae bacterium]|nr:hypothetical protein [Kiritimatiellia bacterium]
MAKTGRNHAASTPSPPAPPRGGIVKKIGLALIGTVLFFALVEGVLRLCGYEGKAASYYLKFHVPEFESAGYDKDPVVFWRLKPGFRGQPSDNYTGAPGDRYDWTVSINANRMRGPETSLEKAAGTFRIISIGDSSAFGWGVPQDKTYCAVLEQLLDQTSDGPDFEVLNAGVPGYSSWQGLQYLRRDLLAYKPDLVLVYFGLNDFTGARFYADKEQRFLDAAPRADLWSLLYRLRLYRFLADTLKSRSRKALFESYFAATTNFRVSPEDYRANLNAMTALGAQHRFRAFFITPVWHDTDKGRVCDYPFWFPARWELLAGVEPVINTYRHIKRREKDAGQLYMDVAHPTPLGHRLIAQIIYQTLVTHKAVPAGTTTD